MDLSKLPTNPETITLNEQKNYRLIEIGKIKDYFVQEIKEQELLIKKLSKYVTGFGYTDKILTASFLTVFSGTNIFVHVKTREKLLGLITSIFFLIFCLGPGVINKVLYETKIRKKIHNKLLHLAKNKLDFVEMLVSQAIIDPIISHDEFKAIMNEKKDYGNQKNTINEGDRGKISEKMLV